MLTVVCWKWKNKGFFRNRVTYTADHINRFASMINRNLHIPHRIVCVTDDATGINSSVEIVSLWDKGLMEYGGCFVRLWAFSEEAREVFGDRFVSFDIDVVITGDITSLVDHDHDFMMWGATNRHTPYCGSLWMMDTGARRAVWDDFRVEDLIWVKKNDGTNKTGRWTHGAAFKAGYIVGSDQAWISYLLYPGERLWRTGDGVYSFNLHIDPERRATRRRIKSTHFFDVNGQSPQDLPKSKFRRKQLLKNGGYFVKKQTRIGVETEVEIKGCPKNPMAIPENCRIVFFNGVDDPSRPGLQEKYPWIMEHWR